MNDYPEQPGRRRFLATCGAISAIASVGPALAAVSPATTRGPHLVKRIPGTREDIPVIGMGSWGTFDIGNNEQLQADRTKVLQKFFEKGGGLIDSSPMYGSSEANIGRSLAHTGTEGLFSATKVWIRGQEEGVAQMKASEQLWGLPRFDLMQIHNFLDWEKHLETLRAWKEAGQVRYIGITTSHGRRADDMAQVIANEPDIDFVQFTYNIADREAEQRLLPLAAEHGKAVIINRAFRRKQLINTVSGTPLPEWAADIDCDNWPQFLLKFVVSHPAVTCVIPATSRVDHMTENMGACYGHLPDSKQRQKMIDYFETI